MPKKRKRNMYVVEFIERRFQSMKRIKNNLSKCENYFHWHVFLNDYMWIFLYIRKQLIVGVGQHILPVQHMFDRRNNFAFESLVLIYKEHLICFLLLNLRLIHPLFSSWPLGILPCFPLHCNYLLGILVFF